MPSSFNKPVISRLVRTIRSNGVLDYFNISSFVLFLLPFLPSLTTVGLNKTGFLPGPSARKYLFQPMQEQVDLRAACFCHRKIIDMGYVCSVCLSSTFSFFPLSFFLFLPLSVPFWPPHTRTITNARMIHGRQKQ